MKEKVKYNSINEKKQIIYKLKKSSVSWRKPKEFQSKIQEKIFKNKKFILNR